MRYDGSRTLHNLQITHLQEEIKAIELRIKEIESSNSDIKENQLSLHQQEYLNLLVKYELLEIKYQKIKLDLTEMNGKTKDIGELLNVALPEEGLNEQNSDAYLRLVEQKLDYVLNMYSYCAKHQFNIERTVAS